MVCTAIIIVLISLTAAMISQSRSAAQSAVCLSRLRMIASAFSQYARDNDDRFPDPAELQQSWEKCLSGYLPGAPSFECPSDREIFPAVGSSYDWRDTADPSTTLAGRLLSDCRRQNAVLAFESLPGWHGRNTMNAALFDGSAASMFPDACLSDLRMAIR